MATASVVLVFFGVACLPALLATLMIGARMGAEIGGLGLLVMLLGQHHAHQTLRRLSVGGYAHHVPYQGRLCEAGSPGSAVSFRVVGPKLLPVGHCEGREGQDVRRGVRQQLGHQGKMLPELFHHSVQLSVDLFGRRLLVDGAYQSGHRSPSASSGGTTWALG